MKLKKLQARVFRILDQCPANLLDPLISIYQLHTADRNYLLGHVSHLYHRGDYKEVGHVFQINSPSQLSGALLRSVSFFFGCISMWIPFHHSSCTLWMVQLSMVFSWSRLCSTSVFIIAEYRMTVNLSPRAFLTFESNGLIGSNLENLRRWLYSFLFFLSLAGEEGILVVGHRSAMLSPVCMQLQGGGQPLLPDYPSQGVLSLRRF